jgi:hypothetical protein
MQKEALQVSKLPRPKFDQILDSVFGAVFVFGYRVSSIEHLYQ